MDLHSLGLPEWLPWWAVVVGLLPVALYLALFLLMPFQTFGLRARIVALEARLDELHEEIRGLTLRLPERGMDPYDGPVRGAPPIPPAARDPGLRGSSLGDPVADRMLAYMRDKAQAELMRGDAPRPAPRAEARAELRPRAEPRFGARAAEPELPPPPPLPAAPDMLDDPPPPRPPRVPGRFGRLSRDDERPDTRPDWQR